MYIAVDRSGAQWLIWGRRGSVSDRVNAANLARFYGSPLLFLGIDCLAFAAAMAWLLQDFLPEYMSVQALPLVVALLLSSGARVFGPRSSVALAPASERAIDPLLRTHLVLLAATLLCLLTKIALLGLALAR
ncbi:hypothetical protein [Pseudoduganella buxea]|uniref:Uncharacterized protein n=1 Tax=Pseudoduganella buxea TaxID=1949069 RepID=A0A6I3T0K2_9BURK|nr:hypothetical protein [Pseudoduganella buxea]MTV55111.1 hypothetical protein [Pseudoduganella buxea]GGC05794.1 hypothetical protein GCM10011572_29600 [Pseudoduganella buxea]